MVSFDPVGGGLYQAPVTGPTAVYWVLLDGSPPQGPIAAADTWNTYSGCHAMVPAAATVPSSFASDVAQACGPAQSNLRALAWIADPASVAATIQLVKGVIGATPGLATTTGPFSLPFANVSFSASADAQLTYDDATPGIVIGQPTSGGLVGLVRTTTTSNLVPDGGKATVPLAGGAAGTVTFAATWQDGDLYTFFADDPTSWDTPPGGEVRYFSGPQGSEQTLRYPVFLGEASGGTLVLDVTLDPLDVFNPARTVLALSGSNPPTCTAFAQTSGGFLTLVPQTGAGFALGLRPKGSSTDPGDAFAYLVPSGTFTAQGGSPTAIRHVMCAMTATEYLLLAPTATITFVPGQHAYAPSFSGGSPPSADPCHPSGSAVPIDPSTLLTGPYTTAWVRVDPPGSPAARIDRGYAMQPAASVYYGSGTGTYPVALGCRISTLEGVDAIPVAPYGQVWQTGPSTLPTAAQLESFESLVLAPARFAIAPKDMTNGPVMFDAGTHTGLDGGAALTPLGLLAQLNDTASGRPGTFAGLMLAVSPNASPPPDAGQLSFGGTPVMPPALAYALMQDHLFLVATDGSALGGLGAGFKNALAMGEWTFQLDLPATVLLLKFTTAASVVDLVADAAYWTAPGTFVGTNIAAVQTQINACLCEASPTNPVTAADGSAALFADFWADVTDPNWTGIVALDCAIEAGDLPIDLQDLLGGITGQLRAHHFGVTVNRVKGTDSSSWALETSSLFALIHYTSAYAVPGGNGFGFQVLRLNVLFENSALTHFDSSIAVTIPQLFGSPVQLPPPNDPNVPSGVNVIEIEGIYQVHGDSGTVVFASTQPEIFTFTGTGMRVIQQAVVTDATLVPVSSTTAGGTITVDSLFAMSGVLNFVADVSPDAKGIDLFSYGAAGPPPQGLAFDAYNVAMTTSIAGDVGTLESIGPDLSQLRVSAANSTVRDGSLLAALPLKLSGFVFQPGSSGWPVKFDGAATAGFAATFALQFQASLGSLGALTSVALEVDLLLAWEPAAQPADADQVWLLMVPPPGMLGQLGFGLQGVLDTTFRSVALAKTTYPTTGSNQHTVYAIYFTDVQVMMLSIPLLPGDGGFTLFADPSQGSASNIAWLMTFNPGP